METWVSTACRMHYADLYRFAYRMLGSREQAEDIAQEAFVRMAGQKTYQLEGEAARRWLFVVARNLCLDVFRRDTHRQETNNGRVLPETIEIASPLDEVASQERSEWVRRAIESLPWDQREVLLLREYHHMSYADLAAVLDCPEGTIRSRLARARAALKLRLEPQWELYR